MRDGGKQTEKKLAARIMSKVGKEFGLANELANINADDVANATRMRIN